MAELEPSALMTLCKLQAEQHAVGSSVCMALPCHKQVVCCTAFSMPSRFNLHAKALSPVLIVAVQQLHLGVPLHGLIDIPAQQMAPQV